MLSRHLVATATSTTLEDVESVSSALVFEEVVEGSESEAMAHSSGLGTCPTGSHWAHLKGEEIVIIFIVV